MWYLLIAIIFISGVVMIQKKFTGREKIFFLSLWVAVPIVIFCLIILLLGKGFNAIIPFKEDRTEREMKRMGDELERYRDYHKQYPETLNGIIGNEPLKNEFRMDYWQNMYFYQVSPDKQNYTLTSPGADGRLRTNDDIVIQSVSSNP